MRKWVLSASAVALSVAISQPSLADVTIDDIVNDAKTTEDVVSNGLGPQGQRYSPLDKVNTGNVDKIVPVWTMSLGGETPKRARRFGSTMPGCPKAFCLAVMLSTVAPHCSATR